MSCAMIECRKFSGLSVAIAVCPAAIEFCSQHQGRRCRLRAECALPELAAIGSAGGVVELSLHVFSAGVFASWPLDRVDII